MFSRELNFDDDLSGGPASIFVQSEPMIDSRDGQVSIRRVLIGLEEGNGVSYAEAYVPISQVQKLIETLQEALDAPRVGERRRAPADDPELPGCEVIRVEDPHPGRPDSSLARHKAMARHWFVYSGRAAGAWTTDAGVADWTVIE